MIYRLKSSSKTSLFQVLLVTALATACGSPIAPSVDKPSSGVAPRGPTEPQPSASPDAETSVMVCDDRLNPPNPASAVTLGGARYLECWDTQGNPVRLAENDARLASDKIVIRQAAR